MKITQEKSIIIDYIKNLKVIINNLTLISHLSIVIPTLDFLISFEELYDKLINHETYLKWVERKTEPTITT